MFLDTFLFNGDWIVKARLEYLYNYVDYFYIVESRYTHSGIRKDKLFIETCRDWFVPYLNKIRFVVNERPAAKQSWDEENYQRNLVLLTILQHMNGAEFTLAVCDADEIYDINTMPPKNTPIPTIIYMQMEMYYYRFTHKMVTDPWTGPFLIHSSHLEKTTDFSRIRVYGDSNGKPVVSSKIQSGWHFSFFMSINDIQRKLSSYAHTDINTAAINNKENIIKSIQNGVDIIGRTNLKFNVSDFSSEKFPPVFQKYHEELLSLQTL